MEGTVNDVLDFRKLESSMFKMSLAPVSLTQLIHSVCRHCRSFLAREVTLAYTIVPNDDMLMLDGRRVFQIITNGFKVRYNSETA